MLTLQRDLGDLDAELAREDWMDDTPAAQWDDEQKVRSPPSALCTLLSAHTCTLARTHMHTTFAHGHAQAEYADYTERVKVIQEEQETRRKLLNTELNKLNSEVADSIKVPSFPQRSLYSTLPISCSLSLLFFVHLFPEPCPSYYAF
jgi:hypothetical protein